MSPPKKVALITGVNGQDGSYLAEFLLSKGYEVHGMVRRTSHFNRRNIEPCRRDAARDGKVFELHYGDLGDATSLQRVVSLCCPDEVYNLAAQSHVRISFDQPEYTTDVNGTGVLRLLEAVRNFSPKAHFYQASTSELYGKVQEIPQSETTPFHPRSAYAVAKMYAFWIVKNYRDAYGVHASNGILFNHESPRRGENFVTRKITYSLAKIKAGLQEELELGNLDAKRDWGYAKDYVEMMWQMLQQKEPDDYVVATGETHTVREFVEHAGRYAGFDIIWEGNGINEIGIDRVTGKTIIRINPKHYRPTEVDILQGNPAKANKKLGWRAQTSFKDLVEIMMKADLEEVCSTTDK